jgi:hypothetical protein
VWSVRREPHDADDDERCEQRGDDDALVPSTLIDIPTTPGRAGRRIAAHGRLLRFVKNTEVRAPVPVRRNGIVQQPRPLDDAREDAALISCGVSGRRAKDSLAVYSQENLRQATPRTYLKRNNLLPRRMIEYVRVIRSFFAISAAMEGMIFYSRCNFSPRSSTIHCFDLKYPASEKQAWNDVVTRISRSLEPLEPG